jgi:hypothetical protein
LAEKLHLKIAVAEQPHTSGNPQRLYCDPWRRGGVHKYRALAKIVGPDPLPYGIETKRKTIAALAKTAFDQGLTPRRMSMNELFVDPRKLAERV